MKLTINERINNIVNGDVVLTNTGKRTEFGRTIYSYNGRTWLVDNDPDSYYPDLYYIIYRNYESEPEAPFDWTQYGDRLIFKGGRDSRHYAYDEYYIDENGNEQAVED